MKRLLLIDAYAMIYRAYYAFIKNPRVNSKGVNTSAMFGFVNILEDLLKRIEPTHVGVAFDPKGKTFRHEAFEAYKAQREATPEDIRLAVPIIKQIVEAYRIPILEVSGFEADDVIGTLAQRAEKEGFTVFMATPDKDYGQLVSEHIFMYRPRHSGGFEQMGIAEVCAKFELDNKMQVIDLLGLMGDSSDNIPGCPGVGPKTAVKLLQEFGSIENLLANTHTLKGALQKKIEENIENINFSKFLATIRTDVPIDFEPDRLLLEQPDVEQLTALYTELEFRSFLTKLGGKTTQTDSQKEGATQLQMSLFGNDEERAPIVPIEQSATEPNTYATIQNGGYKLLQSKEETTQLLQDLLKQKVVCFDTETTDVNAIDAALVGASFSWKKGEAYYIHLPEERSLCMEFLTILKPFFEATEILKVGQNLKYDLLVLKQYGIEVAGKLFDTMIAHYLLQPELRHNMDYLAEIYLQYKTIHYEELVGGRGKKQLSLRQVERERVSDYACEDADITFRLYTILDSEITSSGLANLFWEIEMPLMRVLTNMEHVGVRIDTEALAASSLLLTSQMGEIEREIHTLAGVGFNVSSPKQVGEILFDRLQIDQKAKKTKTGQYSTSEEVLEGLRSRHEIVEKILEYRGIKKLLSTYIDALPLLINKRTGKVHTSYNQTVAATGRLSSSNPNLQNIPIRTEQGKEIRKAFIPGVGSLFISADYSQIELRIMAHLSNDTNMIEAFNSGHDVHAATAAKIYNIPIEEVTGDMRRKAKTANFGIIYGISVFGLSERLSISRTEAKELIDGYFATYPQVKEYMDLSIQTAKERGYAETILKRKRFLADINSQNGVVRGFAERNAINAPIQGSAADIIKIAMVRIADRFQSEGVTAQMTMQVHDELNFDVPQAEVELVKRIVVEEMQNAVTLRVPLIADLGVGNDWLQAH